MPTDQKSNQEIGRRLELTRRALGFQTQTEFADALSSVLPMSSQRWNAYERGRERPPVDVALALSAHPEMRISLDWIYLGDSSGLSRRLIDSIRAIEEIDKRRR